jgi:hypothetical protein
VALPPPAAAAAAAADDDDAAACAPAVLELLQHHLQASRHCTNLQASSITMGAMASKVSDWVVAVTSGVLLCKMHICLARLVSDEACRA